MFGFPWHGLDDRKAAKSHFFYPSTDGNYEVKTYYVYTYITRWWFGTFFHILGIIIPTATIFKRG